jgi:TonB-dependent starch-binding outer membrane protein SusC
MSKSLSLSRSSLWYALASLTGCNPTTPATLQPLPASFAGVEVIRTARGGTLIHILGGPVGAGEPLYVIDGAPLTLRPGQGLDWVAPEQIVRIEVLKHPAETAIYGPRGANGVVLITTTGGQWPPRQ